jgi:hypothetical protein
MNKKKLEGILFFIADILFFISAIIKKDYMSIPLGCCFVILGISRSCKEE